MNSRLTRASVVAFVIVLSGCAGGGAVKAAPAATPSTSAAATMTPKATTSTPPAPKPSPVSESAFCRTVLAQTRPAVVALKKLAKHPDGHGLTTQELQTPRDLLHGSEATSPKHLRTYLHMQVAILDAAIKQVQTGRAAKVKVNEFIDAKTEFILSCEMVE